jgi:hypothetical protein
MLNPFDLVIFREVAFHDARIDAMTSNRVEDFPDLSQGDSVCLVVLLRGKSPPAR